MLRPLILTPAGGIRKKLIKKEPTIQITLEFERIMGKKEKFNFHLKRIK